MKGHINWIKPVCETIPKASSLFKLSQTIPHQVETLFNALVEEALACFA